MRDKLIIGAIISVIFISIVVLTFSENALKNEEASGSWTLSFENPRDNSLTFNIANYSANQTFDWKIYSGNRLIKEGTTNVANNETATEDIKAPAETANQEKYVIRVTSENGQIKEIYKYF